MENKVLVKRLSMDLGNSMTSAIFNGNIGDILELPTAIVEISEKNAKGYFTDKVKREELIDSLLLKVEGKYYLIGEQAERQLGNDSHIGSEVHEKSTSLIPQIMFFAAIALHDATLEQTKGQKETKVDVELLGTMLPIFEVKNAAKFADKTNAMAERFLGEKEFEVVTNGCEKTITVDVKHSVCRVEGFIASGVFKYQFDLNPNYAAIEKYKGHVTINTDIGGGTIDMVEFVDGFSKPRNRNSFQSVTEAPFLKAIKDLYEEKLVVHNFRSARDVEKFIVEHYKKDKYVVVDGRTGRETDITEIIETALRDYTYKIMPIILKKFPTHQGETYKYTYFGGTAPILRKFIKEYLVEEFGERVFEEKHHIESDQTARFLNLYGLEISLVKESADLLKAKA